MEQNDFRVKLKNKIGTKIVALVVGAVLVSVIINLCVVIPSSRNNVTKITKNYMLDCVTILGKSIDEAETLLGTDKVLSPDMLKIELENVAIQDVPSSYAYLVSPDKTMLWHPTTEKIGQPVENSVVKGLAADIEAGKKVTPDTVDYEFKGATKYASYYVGKDNSYILVITADESEILQPVKDVTRNSIIGGVVALLACGLVGLYMAIYIAKPIQRTTEDIAKLAELDLSDIQELKPRKDETGVMMRAIQALRKQLVTVMKDIDIQCEELRESADILAKSVQETSGAMSQLEKAMDEVAVGATAQAGDTQTASSSVMSMGNLIQDTNTKVDELLSNADVMTKASNQAREKIEELSAVNQKTMEAFDVISEQTNATNDSVTKIREVTDMISTIANETNLLSLNASIEAARAGEAGRGFAVVASEIQQLATQSNESANKISEIINLLIEESEKTVSKMNEVKEVIKVQDENVISTKEAFQNVKNGIDASIKGIKEINDKTRELDAARDRVVDVVQSLSAIAEENAASAEETSASATTVDSIVATIDEKANSLNDVADKLFSDVKQFKL